MKTIAEKYEQLGGHNSFLRSPIEDEHSNPDGIGRCRHFEDGAIYWHPETGTYEVHGAINAKWMELGGLSSILGYPISDELTSGDGRARCSCFQKGRIYWTPEAGTWSTDLHSDKAALDWIAFNAKPLPDDWLAKYKDATPLIKVDYSADINLARNQGNKSGGGYGCMTYAFLHVIDILKDWEHPYSPAVSWRYADWKRVDYLLKHGGIEPGFAWTGETGFASEGTCPTNWDTEHQLKGTFPDGWPISMWNAPSQAAKDEASLYCVKIGPNNQVKSGTPSPSIEEIKQLLRTYGPIWCAGNGHAKAIVGYDDTAQQFKILDSYVHNETGGHNITYIAYSQVQPDGEISEFFKIINIPTEQRLTGRYAYSARIKIRNNWRGTYTISTGVEGQQPLVVWTTRGRDRNIGNYTRYDWQQDKIDDGHPLPTTIWHLPDSFTSGVDAALNGQGKYAGKAYFFKGNQYVRYDWQQDKVDDGHPLPITEWHLPSGFTSGIDAALDGQGKYAGKAYFFKGDQYVCYDWQQDKVDDGYPLPITEWHLFPGGFVDAPAVVSRDSLVCNVYVRGTDNALWQRAYYGGQWQAWQRHNDGVVLASMPAVGSMTSEHEYIFARGTDGQLWQKWWTASGGWSAWIPLGKPPGGFVDAPAIVSRDSSVCNVYVRGTDNALWQRAYYGGQWQAWQRHNDGAVLASMPAVGSMTPEHEYIFARGTDGQLWQKWWTASGGWSAWIPLGKPPDFASSIDAALNGQGKYVGKAYFFSKDYYVRYDWQKEQIDEGYPRPITEWHLSNNFGWGIDAALNGQGKYAGKAYFFTRNSVPLETSEVLAIDVPLPNYAASYWPPNSSHRWFLRVEDHDRDSRTGQITEFTLARRYVHPNCHSVGKYRTETFGQSISITVPDPTTGLILPPVQPSNPPMEPNSEPGIATVYVPSSGTSMAPSLEFIKCYSINLTGDAAHSPAGKITLSGQLIMTSPILGPVSNQKVELFELDRYAINKPSNWWVLRNSTNTKNDGTFQFEVEAKSVLELQTYAVAFSDQGQVSTSSDCLVIEYRLEGQPFPLPKIVIRQESLPEAWAEMQKLLSKDI